MQIIPTQAPSLDSLDPYGDKKKAPWLETSPWLIIGSMLTKKRQGWNGLGSRVIVPLK